MHNCNDLQVTHVGGSKNLSRNPQSCILKSILQLKQIDIGWRNCPEYLEMVTYSPYNTVLSTSVCFLCPFFHAQLQVTFVFLSATFKCSAHVLCLIFFYYLPSLSLSSPPSLTSNYPVYVKGKTFPSSLPVRLTSASFRGLRLDVLICVSPRSTLPVLPVLKYKKPC